MIFQPLTEADVSAAVKYAVGQQLEIAVNVGGHSFVGASSSDGVIIDLRRMNTVYVTNSGYGSPGTVTMEGGALVSDVARACEESGVFVSLPSHKEIGYAGFALGTGAGWGMGVWGLAVDNLISARLVLASGEAIELSETFHPELFWGLKGAGYNFGVVTQLTFRAIPLTTKVFFGTIVYPVEQYEAVFQALDKYNATQKDDDMVFMVFLPYIPNGPPEAILLLPYYHGDDITEARKRFAVFFSIPHVKDDTRLMWFHETADQAPEALWPHTHRLSNGTLVTRVEPEVFLPVIDRLRQWYSAKPDRKPGSSLFVGMYNWSKVLKPVSDRTSAWPPSRERPGDGDRLWKDVAIYLGYVSFVPCLKISSSSTESNFISATDMVTKKNLLLLWLLRTTLSGSCAKSIIMLLAKMSSKVWSTRMRGCCPSSPANTCTRTITLACRKSRQSMILLMSSIKSIRSRYDRQISRFHPPVTFHSFRELPNYNSEAISRRGTLLDSMPHRKRRVISIEKTLNAIGRH